MSCSELLEGKAGYKCSNNLFAISIQPMYTFTTFAIQEALHGPAHADQPTCSYLIVQLSLLEGWV